MTTDFSFSHTIMAPGGRTTRSSNVQPHPQSIRSSQSADASLGVMEPGGCNTSSSTLPLSRPNVSVGLASGSTAEEHISQEEQEETVDARRLPFTKTSVRKNSSVIAQGFRLPSGLKLRHPSFQVVMKSSYASGRYSPVPLEFVKRYLKKSSRSLRLEAPDGRTWLVGFSVCTGRAHLRRGWATFLKENNLKEGNACVFEMIKDAFLKVHVFPSAEDILPPIPNLEGGLQSSEEPEESVGVLIDETQFSVEGAASRELEVKHPSFKVAMKAAYVQNNNLPLPLHFMKRYLIKELTSVTLKVSDERTWLVGCSIYQTFAQLNRGWGEFVRENNIREGDFCVFELIKKEDAEFKVLLLSRD